MPAPLDGSIEADKWAKKIRLVKKKLSKGYVDPSGEFHYFEGYIIEGAPPWGYKNRYSYPPVDEICTTYIDTKYWYGLCRHHAYVWTNILQERIKGQWHMIGDIPVKAMYVVRGAPMWHAWVEICVKGDGYYMMHVATQEFEPRKGTLPIYMGNKWNQCETDEGWSNLVYYNRDWAGEVEIPKKTIVEFKSEPTGAELRLTKH